MAWDGSSHGLLANSPGMVWRPKVISESQIG